MHPQSWKKLCFLKSCGFDDFAQLHYHHHKHCAIEADVEKIPPIVAPTPMTQGLTLWEPIHLIIIPTAFRVVFFWSVFLLDKLFIGASFEI